MKCCFCFKEIDRPVIVYRLIPCIIKENEIQYINCNNEIVCHEKCIANNNKQEPIQKQEEYVERNNVLESLII